MERNIEIFVFSSGDENVEEYSLKECTSVKDFFLQYRLDKGLCALPSIADYFVFFVNGIHVFSDEVLVNHDVFSFIKKQEVRVIGAVNCCYYVGTGTTVNDLLKIINQDTGFGDRDQRYDIFNEDKKIMKTWECLWGVKKVYCTKRRPGIVTIFDIETLTSERGYIWGVISVGDVLISHKIDCSSKIFLNGKFVDLSAEVKENDFLIVYPSDYFVPLKIQFLSQGKTVLFQVRKGVKGEIVLKRLKLDEIGLDFYCSFGSDDNLEGNPFIFVKGSLE